MLPGNEGQLSDIDLDQKIAERSRAIALNQNDAKAYRDRGLLLARKREYDLAMSDLNKALALGPNDAHAFGLRGLVWEKKNDSKCALADLEKAIQLDPANAAIYRSHKENNRTAAGQSARGTSEAT
jgi:tetratricopeptide (TPR) repeat protein